MQGKGWENGQVYFPEPHTDFIFTNVAEQFGFLGASVIISFSYSFSNDSYCFRK